MLSPTFSPTFSAFIRQVMAWAPATGTPSGVRMEEHFVPSSHGAPPVRIVIFERDVAVTVARPALLWMHGGGYVIGRPEQDVALVTHILERLDIATGGQSAGGGLAAALAQRAVDHGPVVPAFQLLVYPMLDALTTARVAEGDVGRFVWTQKSNRFGWESYLGQDPTAGEYPAYAVPAARADLAGLPAAWIGVGTLDLFHDEDVAYGERLRAAGVACDMHVVDGGYHGFDLLRPAADITARFYDAMLTALSRAIDPA